MKIRKTAGGIIIGPENKIAVVNQNHNSWSLPKGHIDPGENARQAAEREIKEETGLSELQYIADLGKYRRGRIPLDEGYRDPSEIKEIEMFLYKTKQTDLRPEDPNNPEARWVDIGDVAPLLTHERDKEFLNSIVPMIRQHL